MPAIKARRKLSDLYQRGREVRFGPGPDGPKYRVAELEKDASTAYILDAKGKPEKLGPDEVQVWIRPPSPLQREMAMRDAQASRARSLVRAKRHEDSEEHLTIMAFLADMSMETLIDYVIQANLDEYRQQAIREVLANDEWEDMTSYQDAMRQFEEQTPEELEGNEEYEALMELDAKFAQQVSEVEKQIIESCRDAFTIRTRQDLEKMALDKRSELVGSQAFMAEYEKQMLYYSVRDFDEPTQLFYSSATELAEADDEILSAYREAIVPFIDDSAEAKNLQGVVSGSDSSELPSEPETSAASTPETASA